MLVYILLDAAASSLMIPRRDSMLVMSIDPDERARITALIVTFTTVFSIPFDYIAGYLSNIDRRLPFALNILLALAAFAVASRFRENAAVSE